MACTAIGSGKVRVSLRRAPKMMTAWSQPSPDVSRFWSAGLLEPAGRRLASLRGFAAGEMGGTRSMLNVSITEDADLRIAEIRASGASNGQSIRLGND